jgi:hypothetical protein
MLRLKLCLLGQNGKPAGLIWTEIFSLGQRLYLQHSWQKESYVSEQEIFVICCNVFHINNM